MRTVEGAAPTRYEIALWPRPSSNRYRKISRTRRIANLSAGISFLLPAKPKDYFSERGGGIISESGGDFPRNLHWCQQTSVEWHYIAPGKPTQNAFVESFNGRLGMSALTTRCSRRYLRPATPSPHGRRTTTTTDHTRLLATCRRPSSQ
ncbi:MAG: transposase [Rhizobiales bacterium]|nr:transposase [Hyphomicrobiales bacterium]